VKKFESLERSLDGVFDLPVSKLTKALQQRVNQDFHPWPWEKMDADQRRNRAQTWDFENDPTKIELRSGIDALTNKESPHYSMEEKKRLRGDVPTEQPAKVEPREDLPPLEFGGVETYPLPRAPVNSVDEAQSQAVADTATPEPQDETADDERELEDQIPWHLLAPPSVLIDAFKTYTGMDKSWFDKVDSTPGLLAARRVRGKSGRNGFAAQYLVFEVMKWLIDPKPRKKGKKFISDVAAWRVLKHKFPKVYEEYQALAPDPD
jgi:hypothetical protein